MANEITLPKLSDTMEEGKVLRWIKQVGDRVAAGEVIAEVETDKADMEIEAPGEGVLSEIRVQVGETAPVGAVLALLSGSGAAAAKRPPDPKRETQSRDRQGAVGPTPAPPDPKRETQSRDRQGAVGPTPAPPDQPPQKPPAAPAAAEPAPTADEKPSAAARPAVPRPLRASPLAQRLARERGVDLGQVRGTGAEGKIVARDVEPVPPPAAAASPAPIEAGRHELSKMRQSIARRMTEAKNGIPHFYVTAEIEMGEALRLLEALKRRVDPKITVSHVVAKAAALALLEHPRVNGQWEDGAVRIPESVNIGLAVAVDDGLIVPVIHRCESLSLAELAAEARRLVAAARGAGFSGDDLKGGTFSISNLGILDVDEFSAIINPPQAAILAVGSIKERPVVRAGQLAVGRTMRVTLSCDHRQLNGVEGARYLETLRSILENPLEMLV